MTISNKNKKDTSKLLICTLILVCFIVAGFYVKWDNKKERELLAKHGISTIGSIYYTQNSTRGMWVKYTFKVNNESFKGVLRTYKKGVEVGQKYEVKYLPSNPEINRITIDNEFNLKQHNSQEKLLYKPLDGTYSSIVKDSTLQDSNEISQHNCVVDRQSSTNKAIKNGDQGQQTYMAFATVMLKFPKVEYLREKNQTRRFYYAKLKVGQMMTNNIKIECAKDRQIYENLNKGDTVLVKMTEGKEKSVSVLNWHPTPKQIEKYKTPVRLIEKNQ